MVEIPKPYNLVLTDPRSRKWYFKIEKPSVNFLTQEQFSVVLNAEGRKIGNFDEQRDWSGGRGGERFSDDPTKYRDGKEVGTWIEGHVFLGLQWQIASGYRDQEMTLAGSKSFRALIGSEQSIGVPFTASASSNRERVALWVRRVGTPNGDLTVELRTASGGSPTSTVLKSKTVTTTDITDTISELWEFVFSSVQAVTATTIYWIVACGADGDDDKNHWEVAVDTSTTNSKASASGAADAGTWVAQSYSLRYRITDEDTSRRWWFFIYAGSLYKVSDEATTKLYKWNESTDLWEIVTGHGLTTVTGRPVEMNGFCYFPCGDSTAIRVYNGSAWDAQTVASGQGCATFLALGFSASDNKVQMWRANNALVSGGTTTGLKVSVSRADAVSTYTTDLAFRNSILIGDNSTAITGIDIVNNALWVRKTNEIGSVDNDRYTELNYGVKKTPDSENGRAFISWNGLNFFNWLFSTSRIFSGTVDDIGQGFKSNSFPYGREGTDSAYTTYIAHMFAAKDAGTTGTSSVMLYDGLNWHEFSRAWKAGKRIRDVFLQPVSNERARLWFDCGGDSVFVELPYNKANPLDDPLVKYMHEGVLVSSKIDMGTASKLPKLIKDLTITTKNLNKRGIKVNFEYQLDDEVEGSVWRIANRDSFIESPEDTININKGNIRAFAYRLRLQTDNQLITPDIQGVVPTGLARSPFNRILEVTAMVKDTPTQKQSHVMTWLEEIATSASLVHVDSDFDEYKDFYAVVAPPTSIFPIKANPDQNQVSFTMLVL